MNVNILAVGDVCGQAGIDIMTEKLPGIKKWGNVAFTVVNGENAGGLGLSPGNAEAIFSAGADAITLGNHTWSNQKINKYLDECRHIVRPSNFAAQVPGRGLCICETDFGNVCVINLIGQVDMPFVCDNPFFEADKALQNPKANIILVDFHAEATSEKHAMAYYLDGRVSAVWGTHTHVQTSDIRIFSGGTGYITDLGMTGACDSIIGMKPQQPISRFLGNPPERFEPATGPSRVEGAIFEIDIETGKCVSCETIRVT